MLNFLEPGMNRALAYGGFYDPALVILSLLAAYLGAFGGLSVIQHMRRSESPRKRRLWLVFGAFALGNGIFAMHFIGMLAYNLPVPIQFDIGLTALSGLPAFLASAWMLHLVSRATVNPGLAWYGGAIGGLGVAFMHYTGMMAMRMEAAMRLDKGLFALSLLLAMIMATLAVKSRRLSARLGMHPDRGWGRRISPLVMALAISGMHYTGMAATWFFPQQNLSIPLEALLDPVLMGMGLANISFVLIVSAIMALYLGGEIHHSERKLETLLGAFKHRNRLLLMRTMGVTFGLLGMVAWFTLYVHDTTEQVSQEYAGQLELDRVLKGTAHDLGSIVFDLNVLVGSGYLAEYLDSGSPKAKQRLIQQFQLVARERRIYDQIRFIDARGNEIVRINSGRDGRTQVAQPEALQNKADRYYFKDAIGLDKGRFTISRFDLNMERGKVEEPYKPMIRFSAPVVDEQGVTRGVVVLNYLGEIILEHIREVFEGSDNKVYLIDQEGYYLLTPHAGEAWGFMFKLPFTLASRFPMMWRYIQQRGEGIFRADRQHFIFATLAFSSQHRLRPSFIEGQLGQRWKVVVHIQRPIWSARDLREHPVAAMVLVCALILGLFVGWIVTVLILSRQRSERAEASALRELEFQKQALDEHAIVSTANVQGHITYVNDKFVAISGYTREELIGHNHRMVKSSEHSPKFYRQMWQRISSGRPWRGEVKNLTKDGAPYWVRATIVPFLNEQGKPFKYVSIRTDVTAMKALEAGLVAARDAAESAAKAKSDFLANMSHEIRTPMNAIIGLSHLSLQTRMTPRQRDYIEKVHRAAASLLRIINDILDFSKIDAGHLDMECIPFSLDTLLDNSASMVGFKVEEKGLALRVEMADDVPPYLLGDPLRLGQVLINLVTNAVKFTERGEVGISVALLGEEEDGVRLEFTVWDSGIGMSKMQIGRLFKAFSQADSSTTRKYGGTGLGLAISGRLVEMMNGSIRVESEPGEGSQFIFDVRLGVADERQVEGLNAQALAGAQRDHQQAISGARLLLAEDNEINQQVARELLAQAQVEIVVAENGREAVDRALSESFDGVLMDLQMPVMDGLSATRELRKEPRLAKLPILAMTANAMAGDREKCLEAGMQDHIAKPIEPAAMFATLARWITPGVPKPLPELDGERPDPAAHPLVEALGVEDSDVPMGMLSGALSHEPIIQPPEIPGVDVAAGVARMGGSVSGYLGLLRRFHEGQCDILSEINGALAAGDEEAAERLAHTLKGLSGTIGALGLAEQVRQLESAIREGSAARIEAFSKACLSALEKLCDDLAEALPSMEKDRTSEAGMDQQVSEMDSETRDMLLNKARELLESYDAWASEPLKALRKMPHDELLAKAVDTALDRAELYDFEGALLALERGMRRIGMK
ncbi:MAG: response regulator [Magnetococcales bacterium]|nr:response regulator [Magnetococcales bacterium]